MSETTMHRIPCTYWEGDDDGSIEDARLEVSVAAPEEIAVELGSADATINTAWLTTRQARQLVRALQAALAEHGELYPAEGES